MKRKLGQMLRINPNANNITIDSLDNIVTIELVVVNSDMNPDKSDVNMNNTVIAQQMLTISLIPRSELNTESGTRLDSHHQLEELS
ncbi:hypothetical protein CHS0354_004309 [Potamilus streckersoni]|uniref:Uncharacterized protein n=1 Tax=Potamilus streckersoni TaxID=2493646 RepID=A0AAE0S4I9_9BIVA|nr:hypothetical protein CHS0354_004309 [Potamilus streckersoni]